MKTKSIIITGLFTAIICVFSVITITIGPVPITLSLFAVFLSAVMLGWKKGCLAVLVYILCGAIGLPVFSGLKGGISILFGPTGGYIIGYIFIALIVGLTAERAKKLSAAKKYALTFAASFTALLICYAFGTAQYIFITKNPLNYALAACVYPFVAFDIIKIIIAVLLGFIIKSRIKNIDL